MHRQTEFFEWLMFDNNDGGTWHRLVTEHLPNVLDLVISRSISNSRTDSVIIGTQGAEAVFGGGDGEVEGLANKTAKISLICAACARGSTAPFEICFKLSTRFLLISLSFRASIKFSLVSSSSFSSFCSFSLASRSCLSFSSQPFCTSSIIS